MTPQRENAIERISSIKEIIAAGKAKKSLENTKTLFSNETFTYWTDIVILLEARLSTLESDDIIGIETDKPLKLAKLNNDHIRVLNLYSTYITDPSKQKHIERQLKLLLLEYSPPTSSFRIYEILLGIAVTIIIVLVIKYNPLASINTDLPQVVEGRNKFEITIIDERQKLKKFHDQFERVFERNDRTLNQDGNIFTQTNLIVQNLENIEFDSVDDSHNLLKYEALAKANFMLSMMEKNTEKRLIYADTSEIRCLQGLALVDRILVNKNYKNEALKSWIRNEEYKDRMHSGRLMALAILAEGYTIEEDTFKSVFNRINGTFFEREGFGLYEPIKQLVRRNVISVDTTITN